LVWREKVNEVVVNSLAQNKGPFLQDKLAKIMRSTLHILVLVVPTFGGYSRRLVLPTAGLLVMSETH